ncbi:alpha/beta fold hydrolase, partial [Thermocatellispora tengchongensis]
MGQGPVRVLQVPADRGVPHEPAHDVDGQDPQAPVVLTPGRRPIEVREAESRTPCARSCGAVNLRATLQIPKSNTRKGWSNAHHHQRDHYEERGDGQRAIVLLPGFGCSIDCWAGIEPLLDGYRAVLMDLPGHAGSAGAHADGDLSRLAETVFDACREIGLTGFVAAGLSLGGAI